MKNRSMLVLVTAALSTTPVVALGAPSGTMLSVAKGEKRLSRAQGLDAFRGLTAPTSSRPSGTTGSTRPAASRATIGATPMAFNVDCTGEGALNIDDFICFQKAFAMGSASANCDGSVTAPVLNVLDFMCFVNTYNAKMSQAGAGRTGTTNPTGGSTGSSGK